MRVLTLTPRTIRVPVYSQIAAGLPLEETPMIGWREIRVPRGYRETESYFAVVINGESLKDIGIFKDDIAVCRITPRLDYDGQLAAVLINGGVTLKFVFFCSDNRVRLESRNPAYRDWWCEADEIGVQAVVVRIERDL